jgi:hypothetical protein
MMDSSTSATMNRQVKPQRIPRFRLRQVVPYVGILVPLAEYMRFLRPGRSLGGKSEVGSSVEKLPLLSNVVLEDESAGTGDVDGKSF